jgi:lactate 2-monooxygenase
MINSDAMAYRSTRRCRLSRLGPHAPGYTKCSVSLSWEDLRWIRTQTHLPIAVKGIQHPDDARLAIDNGADVLFCTNHGGRQANSGISTLQLLPGVVKAAGSTPVMFDSGVRNATDVIIALALGATAVGIGRPYAYALSYGVRRA